MKKNVLFTACIIFYSLTGFTQDHMIASVRASFTDFDQLNSAIDNEYSGLDFGIAQFRAGYVRKRGFMASTIEFIYDSGSENSGTLKKSTNYNAYGLSLGAEVYRWQAKRLGIYPFYNIAAKRANLILSDFGQAPIDAVINNEFESKQLNRNSLSYDVGLGIDMDWKINNSRSTSTTYLRLALNGGYTWEYSSSWKYNGTTINEDLGKVNGAFVSLVIGVGVVPKGVNEGL